MFLLEQLSTIAALTSENLLSKSKATTTPGEVLKFFGVLIFEFLARASLWSNMAPLKYQPAPSFGKTGMFWNRFHSIMSNTCFSSQPAVCCPEHMSTDLHLIQAKKKLTTLFSFPAETLPQETSNLLVSSTKQNKGTGMYVRLQPGTVDGTFVSNWFKLCPLYHVVCC
jgi:hypothetical protein